MECYPFENLPLPYSYSALEPFIDEKTMKLHHDRHLATYINNLNETVSGQKRLQSMTLKQLICCANSLPKELAVKIKNNAGGVYNHRFYFDGLTPNSSQMPIGRLEEAITACFGNFENFKKLF